jgi:hypothetical protein
MAGRARRDKNRVETGKHSGAAHRAFDARLQRATIRSRGQNSIHNVKEPRADRACFCGPIVCEMRVAVNSACLTCCSTRSQEQRNISLMPQSVRDAFATVPRKSATNAWGRGKQREPGK